MLVSRMPDVRRDDQLTEAKDLVNAFARGDLELGQEDADAPNEKLQINIEQSDLDQQIQRLQQSEEIAQLNAYKFDEENEKLKEKTTVRRQQRELFFQKY